VKKKKINKIHIAGMDVKIVWNEEILREHQAAALWVPARETIFLNPIYRGNNLETMKCLSHECLHVIERYMNFSIEEGVLDSIAQGIVVAFTESGLLNPDDFDFGDG